MPLLGVDSANQLSQRPRNKGSSDPRGQEKKAARTRIQTEERQVLDAGQGDSAEACSHSETGPKDTCRLPNILSTARPEDPAGKRRKTWASSWTQIKQAQAKSPAAEPPVDQVRRRSASPATSAAQVQTLVACNFLLCTGKWLASSPTTKSEIKLGNGTKARDWLRPGHQLPTTCKTKRGLKEQQARRCGPLV